MPSGMKPYLDPVQGHSQMRAQLLVTRDVPVDVGELNCCPSQSCYERLHVLR